MKRNLPENVWKFIEKRGEDDCWLWTGLKDPGGYGVIAIAGRFYRVHRIVYSITFPGTVTMAAPKDRTAKGFVLHHCDVRACCNPKHLYIGTSKENARDRHARGRAADVRGENAPNAKLTSFEVEFIRLWIDRNYRKPDIAKAFNTSVSNIWMIKSGDSWGHLNA